MYICITEVDAVTKIPCTVEPQRTGPSMPAVKGYRHLWHDSSTWPVSTDATGTYLRAPRYYGTCDDDADTTIAGVLEVLTEAVWNERRVAEHQARKPFPSWIGDVDAMTWEPPTPYPNEDKNYDWNEEQLAWVEM